MAVNLKQLRYFVAAVDLSNITRAAQKMHVAQPALGVQLRELEEEMGVPLLHRHSRGVDPTQAGQVLYQHARRILEQVDQLKAEVVHAHHAARRPLSVGLPTALMRLIGPDLQMAAAERAQRIALSLLEGPSFFLADAIERQELDLALVYDLEPRPSLAQQALLEEELLFICAADAPTDLPTDSSAKAPADAAPPLALAQVLRARLALGGRRDVARRALARAAGVAPESLPLAYETQSIAAILDLVERGEACSLMPYGSIARELAAGRLRARRIVGSPLRTTMYLARRADFDLDGAQARALIDHGIDLIVERSMPYVERY